MKFRPAIAGLSLLVAGSLAVNGQTAGLGLKFAATDPDTASSSLAPEEVAGVVPQANWNNLSGATGTGVNGLKYDNGSGVAVSSGATVTWSAPNTWRSGGNNLFPDGPDRKLVMGYLDSGNTAASGVNITVSNLDPALVANGYDVYVYFVSDSSANRGGAYIVDPGTGPITKYGSTMGSPAAFVEDPGTDANLSIDGNYLRFKQLTGSSFTLRSDTTLTSPNGFRAPINAIQIVPTPQFGPDFLSQPRSVSLYAGGVARFNASVDGYPLITSVKWQKNGVDVVNDSRISGATTTNLVINNVTAADIGNYTLVATSPRATTTSDAANLAIVTQENSPFVNALVSAGPLSHWRLNEPDTVTNAFDFIGGRTGIYRDGVLWGSAITGPQPPTEPGFTSANTAALFSGAANPGYVSVPTPPLNTNTATFVAWINPSGPQANFTGIFMTRAGTLAGLGYSTNNQIGYTWNNNSSATYNWASGLTPPDNQWSMVAVVIDTNRATVYLGTNGTLTAAINPIAHTAEAWGGDARIGDDAGGTGRTFAGKIDEVAVFNRALSFSEIANLYGAATGAPQNTRPVISPQPVSATRYAGATVQFRAAATGPGNLTYQWKRGTTTLADGPNVTGATTDSLTLRNISAADAGEYTLIVSNQNGSTTTTPVTLEVVPVANAYVSDVLSANPLSVWRLNDPEDPSSGTAPVRDLWGGRTGAYGIAAQNAAWGIEGPRPAQSFGGFEADNAALQSFLNTANSWATVPALDISTNTMTFMAWIYPNTRVANAGIIFARAGQAATGLNLSGNGNLGYTWLDQASTYNFASGLTPPLNQWSLVAVAVEPTRAVLYMINADGVRSATNTFAHNVRTFSDTIRIGGDPNSNNRTFDGRVDEAAIFARALSGEELNRFFQRALGSVAPTIAASPVSTEQFVGSPVSFTVSAVGTQPLTYRWEKRVGDVFQTVTDGGRVSGATTGTLTIADLTGADAGEYRAVVSNSLGTATSESAFLTAMPAPPAPATGTFGAAVLASDAFAYWRLNETADPGSGTVKAYDSAGDHHALYGFASLNGANGIAGPRPADGFKFEDTNTALGTTASVADSWVTTPPLGIATDTLTIVAWINPTTLVANGGIVFARAGQPATGLNLNGAGNLGYHWLDTAATYNWNSGLTPPVGQWSQVAIVVEPTRATAYLINARGVQSATNEVAHAARTFSDSMRIGGDPNDVNRTFNGAIDEVAIFNRALTREQLQGLYNGQLAAAAPKLTITRSAGQVTLTWDQPGTLQSTTALAANPAQTVWTNETTTGNTLTVPTTGTAKFFRVIQ